MLNQNIPFYKRLIFKIPVIIILIIVLGIGIVFTYNLRTQNDTIISSKESGVKFSAEIIYSSLKKAMLTGNAPIVIETFDEYEKRNLVGMIRLYRADGISAFSDNKTLHRVNRALGMQRFTPKKFFVSYEKIDNPDFQQAVKSSSDIFVRKISGKDKQVVIYKPFQNQPNCNKCHGLDHLIRGVIKISAPMNQEYYKVQKNISWSIIQYLVIVLFLTLSIVLFIQRKIIYKVLRIGEVVEKVGNGDLSTKTDLPHSDELGILAGRINTMIDGLIERFKLSKFVSKSTLEHVRSDEDIKLGGEKRNLTVLFSDIRGFTRFSESREPEEVMAVLNRVMDLQSAIIHEFGGDVDKYVGDEIMAVFEGEDMVLRAARAAEKIRDTIRTMNARETESDNSIYVGIGINTGEMVIGNMGSLDRIDRTVIGDAVNLGARLCSAAGKNTIIISEFSYNIIKEKLEVTEHKAIKVKGKEHPVKIYTIRRTL